MMGRPEWPRPYTILTPEAIRRIREEQDRYDQDPERYEREQRERARREDEERQREQEWF
jgi:hypothetical protein